MVQMVVALMVVYRLYGKEYNLGTVEWPGFRDMILMLLVGLLFLSQGISWNLYCRYRSGGGRGVSPLHSSNISGLRCNEHNIQRGFRDIAFTFLVTCIGTWCIFIPGTYVTALVLDWGLLGSWLSVTAYIASLGIIFGLRFRGCAWYNSSLVRTRNQEGKGEKWHLCSGFRE